MVIFYKKWKKFNKTQLTKDKMDLNNRKMKNHPPFPYACYEETKTKCETKRSHLRVD